MGHVICIVSLKGGVGKTTTAVNLSASLAEAGKKTLLIDCDPQGSATTGAGINKKNLSKTLYDAFAGKVMLEDIIIPGQLELMDVVPVRGEFFRAEFELMSKPGKEKILKNLVSDSKSKYDFIIIDTPPSLGLISINGMAAADSLLIPLQCEFLAYESLVQLLRFIRLVKKKINPSLKLAGILLTMYDMGGKISAKIVNNVREHLKTQVFETMIPRSVQLREAMSVCKPLLLQDTESVGATGYRKLAGEVMERISKGNIQRL